MPEIIDFHSHILPGVDDGSASAEESIAMLRMEVKQGIGKVVMTPHFYADQTSPERFLKRRAAAEKQLRSAMEEHTGMPEFVVGAEVHYFPGISEIDCLSELCVQGGKCIMIEMPHSDWTEKMYRELERIYLNYHLLPIVAHIDRYIAPFRTHGIPERLADMPVLVQANASFFLNRWTERLALRMLKKEQIHLLGSDCHNLKYRPPRLGQAVSHIQKRLGANALDGVTAQSERILRIASTEQSPV